MPMDTDIAQTARQWHTYVGGMVTAASWAHIAGSEVAEAVIQLNDFDWLLENKSALARKYGKKHLAILGNEVVGIGDTALEAFKQARTRYPDKRPLLTYTEPEDLSV